MEGTLTADARFNRIEEALFRIEVKLDSKANVLDMDRLEARIVALENGTSPYFGQVIQEVKRAQDELNNLKLKVNTDEAVDNALETSRSNSNKLKLVIWGMIITAIGSIGSLTFAAIQAFR